jgi:hypothetical protein
MKPTAGDVVAEHLTVRDYYRYEHIEYIGQLEANCSFEMCV